MSNIPEDRLYTETHEWIKVDENNIGIVGITDHAQEQLTDIVFVEFPEVDDEFMHEEKVMILESAKAVSDINAPVSGTIVEVNSNLDDSPDLINTDPYEAGWLYKIKIKKPVELDSLLDEHGYKLHIEMGN